MMYNATELAPRWPLSSARAMSCRLLHRNWPKTVTRPRATYGASETLAVALRSHELSMYTAWSTPSSRWYSRCLISSTGCVSLNATSMTTRALKGCFVDCELGRRAASQACAQPGALAIESEGHPGRSLSDRPTRSQPAGYAVRRSDASDGSRARRGSLAPLAQHDSFRSWLAEMTDSFRSWLAEMAGAGGLIVRCTLTCFVRL
mmetsp:Transcript_32599/g.107788  ORF Transcript_32599/g.107788 Transcript_32599/m.107788 type:complete len:204 (+) Transcript_32599:549-1160(+)